MLTTRPVYPDITSPYKHLAASKGLSGTSNNKESGMYKLLMILTTLLVLTGCAQEAAYVDYEFGKAHNDAIDQQIAYKDPVNANTTPEGMAGIHAEKIMDTYQYSFDRDADNAPDNNFTRGYNLKDEK